VAQLLVEQKRLWSRLSDLKSAEQIGAHTENSLLRIAAEYDHAASSSAETREGFTHCFLLCFEKLICVLLALLNAACQLQYELSAVSTAQPLTDLFSLRVEVVKHSVSAESQASSDASLAVGVINSCHIGLFHQTQSEV
jgi:hypothetical protein